MRNRIRALFLGITLVLVMSLGSPTVISRVRVTRLEDGSVTIVRDDYGVPHVFGQTRLRARTSKMIRELRSLGYRVEPA